MLGHMMRAKRSAVRIALASLVRIAIVLLTGAAILPLVLPLGAQEKPRIYITPNATGAPRDTKVPP